jgi:hypothetical protein
MKRIAAALVTMLVLSGAAALAAADAKAGAAKSSKAPAAKAPDHVAMAPDDMKWGDGPPSLPPGAKLAVLEGDPGKAGQPFTVRLRVPDGYKVSPHWHPTTEHVTVISGTVHFGMGDKFDDSKGTTLAAGSFGYMAPRTHHYAWFTGASEIQVSGIGPFAVHYINPADDPRKAKK